jgi:dTDP-glucose 4,6-dehydratase
MQTYGTLPRNDLEQLAERDFKNLDLEFSNIVVIGATGFLGNWLSNFLILLQERRKLHGNLTLIVRDLDRALNILPTKFDSYAKLTVLDEISNETFSNFASGRTVVIFAATSTSISGNRPPNQKPTGIAILEKILNRIPSADITVIHLSSGAVYDTSCRNQLEIPSNFPLQLHSSDPYTQEKIVLEQWLHSNSSDKKYIARNPRLFAFYGPGLQLDRHFAIGEFMKQGMAKEKILIRGNPENLRTYLHPTDAVIQILNQCGVAEPEHKHIGSARRVSIHQVAELVGEIFGVPVELDSHHSSEINNYVPGDVSVETERDFELGIKEWADWLLIR